MKYYSLNGTTQTVNFKEAVILGQAADKGLFFPNEIPQLSDDFRQNWKSFSKERIAYEVIKPYVGDSIQADQLLQIVSETIAFDFPLVQISENIYTLELFHGPTSAFKDVGARFMSRCLQQFSKDSGKKTTVLVATSGDTGGAVADAFHGVTGVEVVILFPSKKVSKLQELQLTTYGDNITALEIEGTFDDCQAMVKQAFADKDLMESYHFSSANSINVARWLSQQFYYFYAIQQWPHPEPPVISVPSGNFGNICAGLMAARSGLHTGGFIAACNENDVFTEFIESGEYRPRASVVTVSNAMDVGNPSNFARVLQVFENDTDWLKKTLSSYSYTSEETTDAIAQVYRESGYLMDPHGAVGYLALDEHLTRNPGRGIFLETAHPAKFADIVEPIAGHAVAMPETSKKLFDKKSVSTILPADYTAFKQFMLHG